MILLEPAVLDRFTEASRPDGADASLLLDRRMKLLKERDRLMLEMARKRLSRRQIGLALGLSPGNVTRRIRRLVNRLYDPLVSSLCEPGPLPDDYRQVGLDHFLHDMTIAEVARARGLSESHARGMIEFIRGWYRGVTARR